MITRRTFVTLAGGSLAGIAAGSLVWRHSLLWAVDRSFAWTAALVRSPEARLRAHFSYLNLDPAGVAQYFADCERYRASFSPHRPLGPDIYTDFLLSTDFFRNGADESRLIRYVGFYDPAVTACNNPLARFDDQRDA
jgi:hypothetical protein